MKSFFFFLLPLLLLAAAAGYGSVRNPDGFAKLCADLKTDLVTIYGPPTAPAPTPSPAEPVPTPPLAAVAPTPAPAVPSPTPLVPSPTPAAWSPPAVLPAEPNWTWTTPDKIYQQVRIIKIEADRVSILHSGGVAVLPIWTLPAEIKTRLNYDPDAAALAAGLRPKETPAPGEASPQILYPQAAPQFEETSDYAKGLAEAKSSNRLLLLHFTGSDWCYYCKMLDAEVLTTTEFRQFVTSKYILVTLDFPRVFPLPEALQQQNNSLAQKFRVDGYPTLVVVDGNEKELARESGYSPGSGPTPVISGLKALTP